MKLNLQENFTLSTTLPKPEVLAALKTLLRHDANANFYRGNIADDHFTLTRVISGRNSFLPTITGQIIEKNHGTEITVVFKPLKAVTVFMWVWLGIVATIAAGTFIGHFAGNEMSLLSLISPVIMLVFALALSNFAFSSEVSKSKKDLIEALKATEKK